jgi:hypothetical protein
MPPAERSVTYDLPAGLRLAYFAPAGLAVGLIDFWMIKSQIGSETSRLFTVFALISAALLGYYEVTRRYKNRYGFIDINQSFIRKLVD